MATHRFAPTHYHNVLGNLPPALTVKSGDTVITQTLDAAGVDKSGHKLADGPNPMNGPIAVEGAVPGDALRIDIIRMTAIRDNGWTRSGVASNVVDPDFVTRLPPRDKITWRIDQKAKTVRLAEPSPALENMVLPLQPMIGCLGVAPRLAQSISTETSAEHGGNMDYRLLRPGTTIWFPVAADGGLFFLGDCHAAQGDGEIVGTGIETSFEVEFVLTLEPHRKITWPRGETEAYIFTLGNARPLDQALQHATTEMVIWIGEVYGLDVGDASHLLGQTVRYDVGNVYDPAYTIACRLEKKWLATLI